MLLKGRVVLVTGASRGIGAATARLLARHGAAVGVNYFRSEDSARTVASDIKAEGGKAVTLKAAFHCCKAFVPPMVEWKKGCVIGISSGLSRHPGNGFCAHSTAKSALDSFMKSLAFELGPRGIRVNVVAPGLTDTDATAFQSKEEKRPSPG